MNKYVFTGYDETGDDMIKKFGNSTLIGTDLHKLCHVVADSLNVVDKKIIRDVLEAPVMDIGDRLEGEMFNLEIAKEIA